MTQSSKKNTERTSSKAYIQRKRKKQQKKRPDTMLNKRQEKKKTVRKKQLKTKNGTNHLLCGYRISTIKGKKRRRNYQKLLLELLLSSLIAILLVYVISLFTFTMPQVKGYGMLNELEEGDRLFVNRLGKVERFSLVYFRVPGRKGEVSVRRIVGLPGEELVYEEERLWVNGEEKVERFLIEQVQLAKKEGYRLTEDFTSQEISGTERGVIPDGKYLVLGDNRMFASDSRFYGLIDAKDIIGVASMKIFPFHEMMKL